MNEKVIAVGAGLAASIIGITLVVALAPPVAVGAQVVLPMTSKCMWLPDAGRVYVADTIDVDGGLTVTTVSVPGCKRRLPGQTLCLKTDLSVPPDYNRYPASALLGTCDSVACVVMQTLDAGAANDAETYTASDVVLVAP